MGGSVEEATLECQPSSGDFVGIQTRQRIFLPFGLDEWRILRKEFCVSKRIVHT